MMISLLLMSVCHCFVKYHGERITRTEGDLPQLIVYKEVTHNSQVIFIICICSCLSIWNACVWGGVIVLSYCPDIGCCVCGVSPPSLFNESHVVQCFIRRSVKGVSGLVAVDWSVLKAIPRRCCTHQHVLLSNSVPPVRLGPRLINSTLNTVCVS